MSWATEFKEAFTRLPGDVRSAAGKTYDKVRNDNDVNFDPERRNFLQAAGGVGAAAVTGGLVDRPVRNTAEGAYDAMVDAIPDSPVDIDVSINSGNGGGNGTAKETQTENDPTDTGTEDPTETGTEDPTETSNETTTDTATQIDLPYDGILEGLEDQSGSTADAFQDYTLTALDANLEGVGLEEAVNNHEDYATNIMDALEGTYADGDAFNVGGYAEIGIQEDLNANSTFKTYLNEADEEEVLEEEIHDYLGEMEVSWN